MGFLKRLFESLYKEKEFDKDIEKSVKVIEKLLEVYELKINSVKRIIPLWEGKSASNFDEAEKIIKEIPEQNKKIQSLINKIIEDDKLTAIIKNLMVTEIKKYDTPSLKRNITNHLNNINDYFLQIIDNLKFLKKILLSQSLYLSRQKGFITGKVVEDLKGHSSFYALLKNEADADRRIKQNILYITRETQEFISLKNKTQIPESLVVEDLTNPFGINFEQYYNNIYVPNFPDPEERDSKEFMQEFLNQSWQRRHMKDEKAHTHLLIAKIKEEVIGGILVEFIGCDNDVCFSVIWYLVVAKEARKKGIGTFLINNAIKAMERDASILGYSQLYGVFDEVNSPQKMTPEEIRMDVEKSMDPYIREEFWEKRGFYVVDIYYEQASCGPGLKPCRYVNLRVKPICKEWIAEKSIHPLTMETIIAPLVKNVAGNNPYKDPSYLKIISEIRNKPAINIKM